MKSNPRAAEWIGRLEVWAGLAYALGILYVLLLAYLGARPGGYGPIFAWSEGRFDLGLGALAVLIAGVVWSFYKRPFFQRRRRVPFLILVLIVGAGSYPIPYPSSHEGHESSVRFRLPFEGEWTVVWGGESKETNLLAAYSAERRWGLDLVVTRDGRTYSEASDFHCVGREVLAPARGTVVRAVGDFEDAVPGMKDHGRNYIVLQVKEGEFVFISNLQRGSLAVAEGDVVESGALLGRVGLLGWSTFTPQPHLAIHLQDTAVPGKGEPIPWRFSDYVADGQRVERGLPTGGLGAGGTLLGQKVAPAPSAPR